MILKPFCRVKSGSHPPFLPQVLCFLNKSKDSVRTFVETQRFGPAPILYLRPVVTARATRAHLNVIPCQPWAIHTESSRANYIFGCCFVPALHPNRLRQHEWLEADEPASSDSYRVDFARVC